MEIERKYLIKELPDLSKYEKEVIEQGYLNRNPAVRIRKSNDDYYMTYKNRGNHSQKNAIVSEEYNLPLNKEAYEHMRPKCDGELISKDRYLIPLDNGLTGELDVFKGFLDGLYFIEVEFPDEEAAKAFKEPDWFGRDVSADRRYSNAALSLLTDKKDIPEAE